MILSRMLDFAVERYTGREAIVDGHLRLTYAQLRDRVCRLAASLARLGVKPGDRVLLSLKNREAFVTAHFATQRLGAVTTPINFRFAAGDIAYCLTDAEPAVAIFETDTREPFLEAVRDGAPYPLIFVGPDPPPGTLGFEQLVANGPPDSELAEVDESEFSLMLYTSGTTGRPKGVPRSHKAEYAATLAQIVQTRLSAGERSLGMMPLYHTMGLRTLQAALSLNGLWVAMPDFDAPRALELIERERITSLYPVPTIFHMLVHDPSFTSRDVSSVRRLAFAGAPMLSSLVQRCSDAFHPEVFVNHYGSTEIYTFTIFEDLQRKAGCAGRPGIHGAVRIVRPDPERSACPDEVLPQGETGEIIASLASDEAFRGYWKRPDADARALRQGWYFTGDLGYFDEDGDLWVAGRVDDMIITGGENVHPVEVEDVLVRHPSVADVAVCGLPDEKWGQVVTAFVVPRSDSVSVAELDEFCLSSPDLARFKRPRQFVIVKAIPKSPVGKILRRKLQEGDYEAL
jgi:2-furoate---CoA ligase